MEEVKMLAPTCAPVNALSLPSLKRKRSDSSASDAPASTKLRLDNPVAPSSHPTPSPTIAPSPHSVASPVASSKVASAQPPAQAASGFMDVNRLRDTITAQLSLEVLLKHNEMRLIDQEIAKCQVALEQLRRCAEIPYPGSSVTGPQADVSAGIGASVLPPGNGTAPISPAPWGVTEGPYSRHYKRWLLPDPRFDGGELDSNVFAGTGAPLVEGRSTRGNPVDFSALAGKAPRLSRNSTGAKLQSLPNGYPVVKEKVGPMLIRRKSDRVLVKLVCIDCHRENFSSTQGFINHCRIAHSRNYASHDAAAVEAGVPVEVDESGMVIGGGPAPRQPTPTSHAPPPVSTPGHVHPLIRSSQLPTPAKNDTLPTPSKRSATPRKGSRGNMAAAVATPPASVPPNGQAGRPAKPVKLDANPSFLASPATPHLSALMRDRGLGLNMDKLVAESKMRVDLSGLSDDEAEDDSPELGQDPAQQGVGAARQLMRTPGAQAASERSDGRKGLERATHGPQSLPDMTPSRPQSSEPFLPPELPSASSRIATANTLREGDGVDHPPHLSPNTIESNQAPSLVSDYGDDYGAGFDSESSSSSEDGDEDEDFRHIQVEDDERTAAPTTTTEPKSGGPSLKAAAPQSAPPLSKPLKQSRPNNTVMPPPFNEHDRDDKHTSFAPRKEDDPNPNSNNQDGRKPPPSQ